MGVKRAAGKARVTDRGIGGWGGVAGQLDWFGAFWRGLPPGFGGASHPNGVLYAPAAKP